MKTMLILTAACMSLLAACNKGHQVSAPKTPDPMSGGKPMPVPGDRTQDHWAPGSSGKPDGLLPDPITGTPNQKGNP